MLTVEEAYPHLAAGAWPLVYVLGGADGFGGGRVSRISAHHATYPGAQFVARPSATGMRWRLMIGRVLRFNLLYPTVYICCSSVSLMFSSSL
jgi:hypothetical protein